MASVAEIQAELDAAGSAKVANIQRKEKVSSTVDLFYVVGLNGYRVNRWVETTSTESAGDQATDIEAGLV